MFDAIVIGARCAGAPTARELARTGHRVLLVDRSKFPSDVPHSTLWIHPPGVSLLRKWGLLERVKATGCPLIRDWRVKFGPLEFVGRPPPADDGETESYAPRRYLLDDILARAAVEAGAELREEYTVEDLVLDGDRVVGIRGHAKGAAPSVERARIVIGAEGIRSLVAERMHAKEYDVREARVSACFTYFRDLPLAGGAQVELHVAAHRAIFAWPTNDGRTLVGVNWSAGELEAVSANLEASYFEVLDKLSPDLAARIRASKREGEWITGRLPRNFFRQAHGEGWALVGDAGAAYEYSTAQGITNAFRQAQWLADAVDAGLSGRATMPQALAEFQRKRDEFEKPFYDFTWEKGTFQPSPPEAIPFYVAVSKSAEATSGFFGLFAQTTQPKQYFSPENLQKIMSGKS